MKKVLLFLFVGLLALSCEKEDEGLKLSKSDVIGIWDVTKAVQNGENLEVPNGAIVVRLNDDDTYRVIFFTNIYTGNYTIDENTVIGVTLDPITEYFEFASLSNGKAKINYSNSEGDKYIFEASKR